MTEGPNPTNFLDELVLEAKNQHHLVYVLFLGVLCPPYIISLVHQSETELSDAEKKLSHLYIHLRAAITEGNLDADPKFILGKLSTLLDLCGEALNRLVPKATLEVARSPKAQRVLAYLTTHEEATLNTLEESCAVSLNELRKLCTFKLVAYSYISDTYYFYLGHKGRAAYKKIQDIIKSIPS